MNELIEALRHCAKNGCSRCIALLDDGRCRFHGRNGLYDAAAKAIEKLSVQAPTWISVEERLPEYQYQVCLVCGPRGGMRVARFWQAAGTDFVKWTDTGTGKNVKVTHWMPLLPPSVRSN